MVKQVYYLIHLSLTYVSLGNYFFSFLKMTAVKKNVTRECDGDTRAKKKCVVTWRWDRAKTECRSLISDYASVRPFHSFIFSYNKTNLFFENRFKS